MNIKRIMNDISVVQKLPISDNIYLYLPDDKDVTKLRGIVLGPTDSPYSGGILLFDINIPQMYPFVPPKVAHTTTLERIHPNLYEGPAGKVCLSILNTWGKHEWASSLTLEMILRTIQSLLDNDPLSFEPQRKKCPAESLAYEMCAREISITSTLRILKNLTKYDEQMQKYIRNRLDYINEQLLLNIQQIKSGVYSTLHHRNKTVSQEQVYARFKLHLPA
jgi:ubiquitin-protein ligase